MSGSLAVEDFGAMGLTSNFGRLSIRAPELDGARLRTRQKRPKKTIGQNARQTPLRTAMRNGWRWALLLHAINCQKTTLVQTRRARSHTGVQHRPLKWCGAGRRLLFPLPSHTRGERSAERRTFSSLHLAVPRALRGTRASRRSTVAILGT